MTRDHADIVVIGAGAAGLMAGIWAGRASRQRGIPLSIVALDGAAKIGVKILVAGGGRCNVTHDVVTEHDYAGGSRNAVRSVLKRFGVEQTIAFFADEGVRLKREETGKLFPTTDDGQTVLDALLGAAHTAGVDIRRGHRVESLARGPAGFVVGGEWGELTASRVILATGGRALPKSGSDGSGYALARGLGHSITARVFPALVPLVLEADCPLRTLPGVAAPARLEVRLASSKRVAACTGPALCTHFGLSGPAPMDISRHYTAARADDAGASLFASWLPHTTQEQGDAELLALGRRSVGRWLADRLPDRLAETLCRHAGVEPATPGAALTRDARRSLLGAVFDMRLAVIGDRGFTHAETTAGGVPLEEITVSTMASKRCEGLHLAGEICDVDGRIGGFSFQWAWATGFIAGRAAAEAIIDARA